MIEKLYLIATIAGTRVAFRSDEVDSVVIVGSVTPVPHAPAHMRGLFALRSRVMTLVDARIVIGEQASATPSGDKAIVVDISGHQYGILADEIEDACFIDSAELPVKGRLTKGWKLVADAMIEYDGQTLLVVDPDKMISPPLQKAA